MTVQTLSDRALRNQLETAGGSSWDPSESPENFAAFVRRENDKWREVVRISGAKAD